VTAADDDPGGEAAVRVTPSHRQAEEWATVLAAVGIPHRLQARLDGWALLVPGDDVSTARDALAAYDAESLGESRVTVEAPPARPLTLVGVYVALLLLAVFAVSGSREAGSAWFEHGSADALRIRSGEWWRAVTALTLHADAPHVLGNAVAAALLVSAACQPLGPGPGLWLVLLAGVGGNLLTAALHRGPHVSVGASTAIFGALGLLAAWRIVLPTRPGLGGGKPWVVLGASVLLLAWLSTGPGVDVLAHLFGLLAGALLGAITGRTLRRPPPAVQWLLVVAAGAAVAGAWRLAF
jgi:membrane associated rhomboid family serine protease